MFVNLLILNIHTPKISPDSSVQNEIPVYTYFYHKKYTVCILHKHDLDIKGEVFLDHAHAIVTWARKEKCVSHSKLIYHRYLYMFHGGCFTYGSFRDFILWQEGQIYTHSAWCTRLINSFVIEILT